MKVRVEGFAELNHALGEITSQTVRKNVARRALRAAAEPILAAFQAATTVLTGNLRENSIVGSRLNRRQRRLNTDKMPVEIYVGTSDPAGIQEEFGNRHQAPKGNLRSAWDSRGGLVALRVISEAMGEQITAAARRQASRIARARR